MKHFLILILIYARDNFLEIADFSRIVMNCAPEKNIIFVYFVVLSYIYDNKLEVQDGFITTAAKIFKVSLNLFYVKLAIFGLLALQLKIIFIFKYLTKMRFGPL